MLLHFTARNLSKTLFEANPSLLLIAAIIKVHGCIENPFAFKEKLIFRLKPKTLVVSAFSFNARLGKSVVAFKM